MPPRRIVSAPGARKVLLTEWRLVAVIIAGLLNVMEAVAITSSLGVEGIDRGAVIELLDLTSKLQLLN